ncbi:MAG TPA: hypothetical protein VFC82_05390 [Actinomycetaceae bacterium]|nr:hypothetical protein [Actinomycetaceae bacterium]
MTTTIYQPEQVGRRRARSRAGITVLFLAKVVSGAVVLLVLLQVLQLHAESTAREDLLTGWKVTSGYGVFYPHYNGNDLEEFESDGHETKIAEAGELYSELDSAGAVFIDASNYREGIPAFPWLPVAPIRVNANYLDAFPVYDEDGTQIAIDGTEEDWVVLVPSTYKGSEVEIIRYFQASRVGDGELEGAVQGQGNMLEEPIPDQFRDQAVRIIWMAPEQDVFSFNATVEIDRGNLVRDPILEVMTPSNSLTIDRLNSITGEINTPLKIRLDGDTQTTLSEIRPTLQRLSLDDNLVDLVEANEAVFVELGGLRGAIAWSATAAGIAALLLLVLSGSFVAVFSDRRRRALIVRRLHGYGLWRTYQGLLLWVGLAWISQVLLAQVVMAVQSASGAPATESASFTEPALGLVMLAVVLLVVDAAIALTTAVILERRNTVKRLKEL